MPQCKRNCKACERAHHRLHYSLIDGVCDIARDEGISQGDLARRLGVSHQRVTQILNCSQSPTLHMLIRLCHGLGRRLKLEVE